MTDFYDGPRRGIADFRGVPHLFESTFANIGNVPGNEQDVFRLSPVASEVFQLAIEDWSIWIRWETALRRGETAPETHPALPIDRARHHELESLLSVMLVIDEDHCVMAHALFSCSTGSRPLGGVAWSPILPAVK